MSDYAPTIRPLNIREGSSHPWIVESETNIPGVKVEIARLTYSPMASLFAASPELLDLCREFLKRYRTNGFFEVSHQDLADRMEEAIASAEGRQP